MRGRGVSIFCANPKTNGLKNQAKESFSREISCLRRDLPIPNNSRLIKTTRFINDEGLLRAKGRPYNVAIDFNAKDPVVVDAKSRFG